MGAKNSQGDLSLREESIGEKTEFLVGMCQKKETYSMVKMETILTKDFVSW